MSPQELTGLIQRTLPDATVELTDLTGTGDHWKAVIETPAFAGKSQMQRQRIVYAALAEELKGPIHALSMETWAPGER